MLFDTSIKNKEVKEEINRFVGRPFHLLDMFKIGSIGSSRMEVVQYSKLFAGVMSKSKQAVFANIALRPKGIVVVLNIRLSNYSWVIPYHHLSIFKTDVLSIHSQGEVLKLKLQGKQNHQLIQKILQLKEDARNG
jgi:hypothetical protein